MTSGLSGLKTTVVDQDTLLMELSGNWQISAEHRPTEDVYQLIQQSVHLKRVKFDTRKIDAWNSGFLTFLLKIHSLCAKHDIEMIRKGLPQGADRILSLSLAVPERKDTGITEKKSILEEIGEWVVRGYHSTTELIGFVGEIFVACLKIFTGSARFRMSDLLLYSQQCGAQALPIVTLISLLVGLILAFVGAVQLKMFGAQIYVANLVGLGMAREMGAMMAAIIMAGRTGAAFASQLGTMQVNEEIDAFTTLGVNPIEFLVLPRLLALVLMMPLLCIYADFMGILGGAIVSVGMLDISPAEYYTQTKSALNLAHLGVGVFKSVVFGIIVAIAGCLRGMQCGRSSAAVGDAATSAVVTGIIYIIISDAVMTIIFAILEI